MLLKKLKLIFIIPLLLIISSCGKEGGDWQGQVDGLEGPNVVLDSQAATVRVTAVFTEMQIDGGITFGIPDFPNSFAQIGPDLQTGGTLISFDLSIDDLVDDRVKFLDPKQLPDGRPLPSVRSGKLPASAFMIDQLGDSTIYVGEDVFGAFIPMDLGVGQITGTFKYYINDKYAGTISIVGENANGTGDGLLLLLNFNEETRRKIARKMLARSRR